MEFLKSIVRHLPLEAMSDVLAWVVFWWIRLVDGVPESLLAQYAYVGGCLLVLALMAVLTKCLPKFLHSFMALLTTLLAALLLTPTSAMGEAGGNAPAVIAVLHSLLMGQPKLALASLLPIIGVFAVLLLIGGLWQWVRASIYRARAEKV